MDYNNPTMKLESDPDGLIDAVFVKEEPNIYTNAYENSLPEQPSSLESTSSSSMVAILNRPLKNEDNLSVEEDSSLSFAFNVQTEGAEDDVVMAQDFEPRLGPPDDDTALTATAEPLKSKPFNCLECGRRFCTKGSLKLHHLIHTKERPHVCETCGVKFIQKSHLKNHMFTHTKEKNHECLFCGKRFSQRGHLKNHTLSHTQVRAHACGQCGKRFTLRGHLTTHMLTHTGEQPYVCDYCGMKFGLPIYLRKHILTHTGEKPYQCDVCGKSFSQKGHLKSHFFTHTKEKPFECHHCGRRFSRKKTMISHINVLHEKKQNERDFDINDREQDERDLDTNLIPQSDDVFAPHFLNSAIQSRFSTADLPHVATATAKLELL